jgi:DNA-binding MarR family transcriptional regulator
MDNERFCLRVAPVTESAVSLKKISRLVGWIQDHLPFGPYPIVSQAAYTVAIWTVDGNPISVKGLVGSLGCSVAGVRKPLQRLLKEGWVVIERDKSDQRVRRVIATGKLLSTLNELARRLPDTEEHLESTWRDSPAEAKAHDVNWMDSNSR